LDRVRSIVRLVKLGAVLLHASVELMLNRPSTRPARALWLHQLCRRAIRIFGVDVHLRGKFPGHGILISNHLSYLDIMVFASLSPCVFISKVEVESWPVIGWMTTMSGTVYVTRGKGGSAREAGSGMRSAAGAGLPVVLFPEGTTSNGDTILKFHTGLLAEAVKVEQPVTAAFLQYSLTEDNGPMSPRDDIAFWGDQPMFPHVFRFLSLRGVRADVTIASEPILFTAAVTARKLIAVEARQAVCTLSVQCSARAEQMEPVS